MIESDDTQPAVVEHADADADRPTDDTDTLGTSESDEFPAELGALLDRFVPRRRKNGYRGQA